MITIFTTEDDITSDEVQDWLLYWGQKVNRVNNYPRIFKEEFSISLSNSKKSVTNYLNGKSVVWFRRWQPRPAETSKTTNALAQEDDVLKTFLSNEQEFKFLVNKPKDIYISKIDALKIAIKCGIDIPDTLITNSKQTLLGFSKMHKQIIVKPLSEPLFIFKRNQNYASFTRIIQMREISEAEEFFTPSIFQEFIKKSFEIRSFYFEKTFHSMAIFSQSDSRTSVDFRHYRPDKPNRRVPFDLPIDLENKLKQLMSIMNLESGSIDLICDNSNRYVFLEVNPVGQFGMISDPCNYYLEKKIAEYLVQKKYEV